MEAKCIDKAGEVVDVTKEVCRKDTLECRLR